MLNKFIDKTNEFSKYCEHTMLFYNHGDALAAHADFLIRSKLYMPL